MNLLGNQQGLDVAAMVRLQADITSLSADRILAAVAGAREKAGPKDAIAALEELAVVGPQSGRAADVVRL